MSLKKQTNCMRFVWMTFLFLLCSLRALAIVYSVTDVEQTLSSLGQRQHQIAAATVALLRTDDDNFLNPKIFGEVYNFCSSELYLQQKLFSYCSGTLISNNKILTAGHCVRNLADCSQIRIAFDYTSNEKILEIKDDSKNLYKCKRIAVWSQPKALVQLIDYAVIELDRPVTDRKPIQPNFNAKIQSDILAVGHPLGLPMKFVSGYVDAEDQNFNSTNSKSSYMKAHMNTHPGLSGAGVYNKNLELAGILVRGEANIERDGKCSRIRRCEAGDCPWAEVQKLPKLTKPQ